MRSVNSAGVVSIDALAIKHSTSAIGAAFFSLVEPDPGFQRAYNRWYEDDIFYRGARAMPWVLGARRYVATAAHKKIREPNLSTLVTPITAGTYLTLYWIMAGALCDHLTWKNATNRQIERQGAGFSRRTHRYTAIHRYAGAAYRDARGPRDLHALDHPFGGIVVEILTCREARSTYLKRLHESRLPAVLKGSPIALSLLLCARAGTRKGGFQDPRPDASRRLVLLHFCNANPLMHWHEISRRLRRLHARNETALEFRAPFIPTIPGSEEYIDEE
jgi:hypothetical protein